MTTQELLDRASAAKATLVTLTEQKKNGVAVIFVGEDLDVLVELCDRILVLCGGKVSGIIPGRGADKREIGMMMTRAGGEQNA